MGMIGNLIRVSKEDLEMFKADSGKLENLIYNEANLEADWYLDLDKSWEAIHYVLSGKSLADTEMDGTSKVIEYVIFSDKVIDEEQDLGYGPAFYNDQERVNKISKELNKVNITALMANFDGKKLNEANVYPEIWDEEDSKEYLQESLKSVIEFYSDATDSEQVVIGFIC
ncbi:YfbM family protein [Fulvivirga kasyanovii]|uniref:DUF1877 family protein n=1 Tax=Fulvivirga kasyanovii TaxID=396812 RepID=A0ABW9RKS9_9BACT|nr:YfbM family protein [Fulvivirga kasyanovii]MTI24281.1 DUF1877 family protein [Fulvivirga kasyanovii]